MPIWSPAMIFGSASSGYVVEDSIWFDGSADYLHFTPDSTTGNKKFTFSCWLKIDAQNAHKTPFSAWTDNNNRCAISIEDTGFLDFHSDVSGSRITDLHTTSKYLDPTAWFNLILVYDSTVSTPSASSIFYMINGIKVVENGYGNLDAHVYPSQNGVTQFNTDNVQTAIGMNNFNNTPQSFYEGYMAEVQFLDGIVTADGSEFGEYDNNGVWVPVNPSGISSYGTNGFHLDFKIAPGTGNGAGTDVSGNDNHFTSVSLDPAQQVTDTCTDDADNNIGNYATLNPLATNGNGTISAGNLNFTVGSTSNSVAGSTIGVSSGKFYGEATYNSGSAYGFGFGIANSTSSVLRTGSGSYLGEPSDSHGINASNGNLTSGGAVTVSSYAGGALVNGTNYMWCLDMDNGKWWAGNADTNTWFTNSGAGNPATGANAGVTGLTGIIHICASAYNGDGLDMNFGQTAFTNASNIPTGFKALNTANLAAPTVTDPSAYFQVKTYTGNGGTQAITFDGNSDLAPDFVWVKCRDVGYHHQLFDTVRGTANPNNISADLADAQGTGELTAFGSDGFTLVHNGSVGRANTDTDDYVAWCWKAGGAPTADNSAGAGATPTANSVKIDGSNLGSALAGNLPVTRLSANTTSGFSIATWTGNSSGAGQTIAHGLGRKPAVGIFRRRSLGQDWAVYHEGLDASAPEDKYLNLNLVAAVADATWLNDTAPTTSIWTLGASGYVNTNNETFVAYSFARTPGLIAAGTFVGANAADGSYIVLDDGASGFRPAWFMFKNISSNGDWYIFDSGRNTYNPANSLLAANQAHNESTMASNSTNGTVDFTANGVKFRSTNGSDFQGAKTFIYLAFAENPFGGDGVAQAKAR